MPVVALTRAVPDTMAHCELTHLDREPIDIALARAQHSAYEEALRSLGCRVERMEPLPDAPDSVFVEDMAVVLDELAIITRPGAEPRRVEVESVAKALFRYREIATITAPATIDGGDVLRVGRRIFVGLSSRTNDAATEQLRAFVEPLGYEVIAVAVRGVLHLKSAVTQVGPSHLLGSRALIDTRQFAGSTFIDVDPQEPGAANAVLVGDAILFPSAFPRTRERLDAAGLRVITLDASELAKAEGALTCCSLLVDLPT
ncbi:MAG TPA: arginine deiminase-related protein [Thermoanaerobaculia bacterium]|nr:arginine deiminase-related protein [Thermoanaerobaculia bacterium]